MPIPLAEIPNAVMDGPAPVLYDGPQYNTNISGVATALTAPQIEAGAFLAQGAAMASVGEAISGFGATGAKISGILSDIKQRERRLQDEAGLAFYSRKRAEEHAAYATSLDGVPEDQWLPGWKQKLVSFDDTISKDLKLSPEGMQRLNIMREEDAQRENVGLITRSKRSAIEKSFAEIRADADQKFHSGDIEGGAASLGKIVDLGGMQVDDAQREIYRQKEKITVEQIANAVAQNPRAALEDLSDPEKAKEMFGSDLHDSTRVQWANRAKAQIADDEQESIKNIEDGIFAGAYTDATQVEEDVKKSGLGAKIGAALVTSFSKVEDSTPAGIAKTLEQHSKLMTIIESYDPEQDKLGQWKTATYILALIHSTMPEGFRETLVTELRQKKAQGIKVDDQVRGDVFQQIDKQASLGVFGPTKKDPADKVDDPALQQAVFKRTLELKQQFKAWQRDNPKATPLQIQEWFTSATAPDILKSGVKLNKENRFNAWDHLKDFVTDPRPLGQRFADAVMGKKKSEPLSMDERIKEVDAALNLPAYDAQGNPNATTNDDPNGLIP